MDTFEIVVVGVVVFAIYLYINSKFGERKLLRRMYLKNDAEWGKIPNTGYTMEKFKSIKEYYLENKGSCDVDDITWNDLDMDTIFMLINNTQSSMGEDYLYAMLRNLQTGEDKLKERERVISFFENNPEKRNRLQTEFRSMGKIKEISLYKYINTVKDIPNHSPVSSICMAGLLFVSIVLMGVSFFGVMDSVYGILLFISTLICNIVAYFNRKAKIEKYFSVFMYIIRMLDHAKALAKIDVPELKEYLEKIGAIARSFKEMERGSFLVFFDSRHGQGSIWDLWLDYVRMMFHLDLIKFDFMVKQVQKNRQALHELYELLGFLDAGIAVASFRTWLGEDGFCKPELTKEGKAFLSMDLGYHPLLENPVTNSICAKRGVLITGSNASGKSTFIKTVAINAILAQTIYTVVAKNYRGSYFKIFSSMALRDDLQGNESYYIVEIKSLKRILQQSNNEIPTLCFVDEVLRGTNTLERIAASAQILKSLDEGNAICFAATHDLELTHILEKHFDNYHFQEEIKDGQVVFDYALQSGRAISRNAIKLLGMMGYNDEIIRQAEDMANTFLEEGVWNVIPSN